MAEADETADLLDAEENPSFYVQISVQLDSWIADKSLPNLITDIDLILPYKRLSPDAKILFLRLYLRKRHWMRPESFNYKEITNPVAAVDELVLPTFAFLTRLSEDSDNMTVEQMLEKFSLKELKTLTKELHLKPGGNRAVLVVAVLKMCRRQRSLFSGVAETSGRVKRRCLGVVGGFVRVRECVANVLDAVLIALFPQFLSQYEEDDKVSVTGKGHLSRILMTQFGIAKSFPKYRVSFAKPLFASSQQLETFLAACNLEAECYTCWERKDWEGLRSIYNETLPRYTIISETVWEGIQGPTSHLLQYTEEWVLTRVMRKCLAGLQRLKDFTSAESLLQLLLKYKPMSHRMGGWWDTLALIQHHHLKKPGEALETLRQGLEDEDTDLASRIPLETRLAKLDPDFESQFTFDSTKEVSVEIPAFEGSKIKATDKTMYMSEGADGKVLMEVEEAALDYYFKNLSYNEGTHCEGSILTTLFGILCWDVVFSEVEDVFYNPYQYHPLDLHSREFYITRKSQFEELFSKLETMEEEDANEYISQSWSSRYNTGSSGVKWDLFTDVEQCQRCVACITTGKLVGMFRRYVRNPRLYRSGLPDLAMWDFPKRRFRMVEVKGPGDTLRNGQKVWLEYLNSVGVKAEICYVKAVSHKKIA